MGQYISNIVANKICEINEKYDGNVVIDIICDKDCLSKIFLNITPTPIRDGVRTKFPDNRPLGKFNNEKDGKSYDVYIRWYLTGGGIFIKTNRGEEVKVYSKKGVDV